jgi:hypothetical protein
VNKSEELKEKATETVDETRARTEALAGAHPLVRPSEHRQPNRRGGTYHREFGEEMANKSEGGMNM